MTAFLTTDIPNSVNTVEELLIWAASILSEQYAELTVIESPGKPNRQITCSPYYLGSATDPGWYVIARATLKVNDSWRQSGRLFEEVNEVGSLPIPNGYTVNA